MLRRIGSGFAGWDLFVTMLLFYFIFYCMIIFNLIYIDMPDEKPLAFGWILSILIVGSMGLLCFSYLKFNEVKRWQKMLWSALFGINSFICAFWLFIIFKFDMQNATVGLMVFDDCECRVDALYIL